MWTHMLYGTDLYHVVQWFIIYSFLGWVVESIYMSFCNRKLTNRGFAFSPFCPIYAVGALSVFALLKPLAGQYVSLYFAGAFTATALEYVTAVVMQNFLGNVWWDYTDKPFNYKGIICLESTVAWGFYTVFLFAFLQGFVEMVSDSYPVRAGMILAAIVILVYTFDFSMHLFLAKKERLPKRVEALKERVMLLIQR
ncbi:MAG: putative ABC transporter permease [Clostridiales bacterium]|nr:putative ABC transporter permease [Clostridiales bacterium]